MSDTSYLDTAAVNKWLSANLSGFSGPVEAHKFADGQSNPTFALKTGCGNYVLRRKPPGILLKSAHAVDREFRVQKALADTDVPVAKMHVLCEDDTVIGSAFYVMQMIDGRNYDNPSLPELPFDDRKPVLYEMNRVLAAIHSIDLVKVGLSDFGPDGNYYRRQTDRWTKQYRATETETIPQMDELMVWLDDHMPLDDGQRALVHGDYRIDNMLFSKTGPECLAVLDWELSTIGHPFADLAAVIMQWSMQASKEGRGLAGIDRNLQGLMEDPEFIDLYCDHRGISEIENFGFYLAFCFFRMGGILQGVKKRALDGNASNPQRALRVGSYVNDCANAGLKATKTL